MANNRIDLIRQALGAAESSIKLAKQLLSEIEGGGARTHSAGGSSSPSNNSSGSGNNRQVYPGVTGIFDGLNMVTESGESYPVPANYSSKSLLVVGDTLKLVEDGNREKRFKQVEHVKRHRTTGIITKKDGKWSVVTPEGSYKVLPEAIEHFGGAVGDEVVLHIPAGNLTVPYGAIESVKGQGKKEGASSAEPKTETPVEAKPAVSKEEDKKKEKPVKVEKKEASKQEKPKPVSEEKALPKPTPVKAEPVKVEQPIAAAVPTAVSKPVVNEPGKEEKPALTPVTASVKVVAEPAKTPPAAALPIATDEDELT